MMVKFVRHKTWTGKTFYRTEDEKYMITRDEDKGTWTTWKKVEERQEFSYSIYGGYTQKWTGFKKLQNAKDYIEELIVEDNEWEAENVRRENARWERKWD